jgi:hypothetical protein
MNMRFLCDSDLHQIVGGNGQGSIEGRGVPFVEGLPPPFPPGFKRPTKEQSDLTIDTGIVLKDIPLPTGLINAATH